MLTSQDSLQNLQDWLGRGSMEGKPAATVRLPEGEGVPQHPPEHPDLTWSPRQQDNNPGGFRKEERQDVLKTTRKHPGLIGAQTVFPLFLQIISFCFSTLTLILHLSVYLSI